MKYNFKLMPIFASVALAVFSGFLMYLSWPTKGINLLLFIALIPLFYAHHLINRFSKFKKVFLVFLIFFLFHFVWLSGSSYWLSYSYIKSYISDSVIESLTFAFIFIFLALIKFKKEWLFWTFFISLWMTVDYLNQKWLLGTPYYILGSGLGMSHRWIQTYEFIGIEGGSIAILLANISIYNIFKNNKEKSKLYWNASLLFISLSPFLISFFFMSSSPTDKSNKTQWAKVSILHTYTPTYNKEDHFQPDKMIHHLWELSKSYSSESSLLLWPETIISNLGWLSNQQNELSYQTFQTILNDRPNLTLCTGGFAFTIEPKPEENPYASLDSKRGFYYNTHNVAISYYSNGAQRVRSKQVFVPFQERVPYLETTSLWESLADVVGSNSKTSAYKKGKDVHLTVDRQKFTPILCFESIYPLNMADQAKMVDFLAVLANEHWNLNFDGSVQYLHNTVAMAIQSRIPIFRSSNNGISTTIDKYGNILKSRKGEDEGIINAKAEIKIRITFYEKINGIFYKISLIIVFVLGVYGILLNFKKT